MMGSRPELPETWKVPESEGEVENLFSSKEPVVIYKHSYNCPTCIFTKTKAEAVMNEFSDKASFNFVDVISNRAVSNLIASKSGVRHESPQLLILHKGEVYWSASHGAIDDEAFGKALSELTATG